MSTLNDAVLNLKTFNAGFTEWVKNNPAADLMQVLRMYDKIRTAYEELDDARKELNSTLENFNRVVIPERMADAGVKNIALEDIGKRFSLSARVSCSILDKPLGFSWLRENGHGDLISETVNSSTLSAFAKSYVVDTGNDLPVDKFKVTTMQITSVTKI